MKNASTQTIAETYGNDRIRRSGAVRRRNRICEERASRTRCKCCRMWLFRSGCNTVPIEKGTETIKHAAAQIADRSDATPSPSRRGLKLTA